MNTKLKAKIREKFGSQANFSTMVKEDESAISRILRNRRPLKPERQIVWAEILGCNRSEIFSDGGMHHAR